MASARTSDGFSEFGISYKRLVAAADNLAVSLRHTAQLPPADRRTAGRTYADGYFAGLCFALGLLVDRSPSAVAAESLGRASLVLA